MRMAYNRHGCKAKVTHHIPRSHLRQADDITFVCTGVDQRLRMGSKDDCKAIDQARLRFLLLPRLTYASSRDVLGNEVLNLY